MNSKEHISLITKRYAREYAPVLHFFFRPGASSMLGLLLENGPIHVTITNNIVPNNYSWDQFMDYVWLDVSGSFLTYERTFNLRFWYSNPCKLL